MLGTPPRMLLDVEPLVSGDGEREAARRLLTRVAQAHGRWVDLLVVDAEYAAGPWLNRVIPRMWVREDGQAVQAWEAWGIRSWEEEEVPLRVVRFREASPDGVIRDHLFATTCPEGVSLQ